MVIIIKAKRCGLYFTEQRVLALLSETCDICILEAVRLWGHHNSPQGLLRTLHRFLVDLDFTLIRQARYRCRIEFYRNSLF